MEQILKIFLLLILFQFLGEHTIYINHDIYIYYMNDCFCGFTSLEYVDLSELDLTNNHCFMNFFKGDKNLKVFNSNNPF